jgi:Ca2+-binding EF-hand superfamily protein
MKYLTIALSLAAAVIAQSPTAMAQDASAKAREMFIKADTNQDGALSLEEWKAAGRRDRGFAMIDADKDGKVTPDELRAAAAKRGNDRFPWNHARWFGALHHRHRR